MQSCPFCSAPLSGGEDYCGQCGKQLSQDLLDDAAHIYLERQQERWAAQEGFHAKTTVHVPQRASRPPQKNQQGAKPSPSVPRRTPSAPPPPKQPPARRSDPIGEMIYLIFALCIVSVFAILLMQYGIPAMQSLSQRGQALSPSSPYPSVTHTPHPTVAPSRPTPTATIIPTPSPTPIPPTPTPSPTPAPAQPGTVLWSANLQDPSNPDGWGLSGSWHIGYGLLSCASGCDDLIIPYVPTRTDYALEITIVASGAGCLFCDLPEDRFCIHVTDTGQSGYCAILTSESDTLDTGTTQVSHPNIASQGKPVTWRLTFHQGTLSLSRNGAKMFPLPPLANACPDAGYATIHFHEMSAISITSVKIIAA